MAIQSNDHCQDGLGASARPQWSGNLSEKQIECESKGPNPGKTGRNTGIEAFSGIFGHFRLFA